MKVRDLFHYFFLELLCCHLSCVGVDAKQGLSEYFVIELGNQKIFPTLFCTADNRFNHASKRLEHRNPAFAKDVDVAFIWKKTTSVRVTTPMLSARSWLNIRLEKFTLACLRLKCCVAAHLIHMELIAMMWDELGVKNVLYRLESLLIMLVFTSAGCRL